ncbi:ATP-dependent DNA ligase [Streptomyces sp. NBC_01465]|uniref:ATP-dependent DNA ligase n=1 Tax=Streptomyces sp. NBC_01465 TaxID=2903878 RepID=UPI002E2F1373|nr:ATP-dependent DNA ligase [Streptomyces sp. NBC_01465]
MKQPVDVALAATVRTLPDSGGWAYEPKFDGHRMVVIRGEDVVLQARSGRNVTGAFPDLVAAARELPAGTVLDGEVVVWTDGRTDFAAVQHRASASATQAAALAVSLPASYAAFDLLEEGGTDLRTRPYELRREQLVALLTPLGPPLQPVPMTTAPATAALWYDTLPATGIEGLVAKRLDQPYRGGTRAWSKLRHSEPRDAVVVGHVGSAARPSALLLVLPGDDDTPVQSSPLAPALRGQAGAALAAGELGELAAEVEQGTTARHAGVTVMRLIRP